MENFKALCKKIKESMPRSNKWESDNRFGACLSTLVKNDADKFIEKLLPLFAFKWDSSNSGKAAKSEKKLIKSFSGLQKGQILFTSIDNDNILFAACWPWGDNSKVSIRIGYFSNDKGVTGMEEIKSYLS